LLRHSAAASRQVESQEQLRRAALLLPVEPVEQSQVVSVPPERSLWVLTAALAELSSQVVLLEQSL